MMRSSNPSYWGAHRSLSGCTKSRESVSLCCLRRLRRAVVFSADIQSRSAGQGLADEYSRGAAAVGDSLGVDCHDRSRGNESV